MQYLHNDKSNLDTFSLSVICEMMFLIYIARYNYHNYY